MNPITSPESLDAAVARVVSLRNQHTTLLADKEAELIAVEKKHQLKIGVVLEKIAVHESAILDFCANNRADLFPEKKSRETGLAVFGFELKPWRVETANKKIKWQDVVVRLARLRWGPAYIRTPAPAPDKEALLANREHLTPEQLISAGLTFRQDEQFFIRPKPETAADSKTGA